MNELKDLRGKLKRWAAVWAAWTFVGVFLTSQAYVQFQTVGMPIPFWQILSWQLFSGYVWFALSPIIYWLIRTFTFEKKKWLFSLFIHIFAGIALTLIQQAVDALVLPKLGYLPNSPPRTFFETYRHYVALNFHFGIAIYWSVLGIYQAFKYYQKARARELQTTQLEARLAQTRLQVLKFQLQPHFLFNTLNTISELVYKSPESADRMITNLSDLLRLSLEKLEVQEVSLQQELDFLQKYVEIEQMRFHDRLKIEMNVAPETLDAVVPNMILQPLVENSIKHGIAPLSQGGTVKISAERRNGSLLLDVSDNGIGLKNLEISEIPHGVGLKNTRARLKHLYGENHKFEMKPRAKGGVQLNLTIPYQNVSALKDEDQEFNRG